MLLISEFRWKVHCVEYVYSVFCKLEKFQNNVLFFKKRKLYVMQVLYIFFNTAKWIYSSPNVVISVHEVKKYFTVPKYDLYLRNIRSRNSGAVSSLASSICLYSHLLHPVSRKWMLMLISAGSGHGFKLMLP